MLIEFDEDFMGLAAVSLRSSLKYRRNWDKNGPTVQLLRKFMPRNSKGFRAYIPVGKTAVSQNVTVPLPVRLAVKQAGFRITNYLAKKCVKLSDKEQKNEFNIGKVISKDPVAKAAFDNDPQLQNSNHSEFTMVVSCHPYDIIGMSTGRSWDNESCMRLRDNRIDYTDGINKHFLERDVAEGTLVAYVIRSNDANIEKPLGRCLLKPFVSDDEEHILYRRETKIYGNPVPGFSETLNRFLRKLNAGIPAGIYRMKRGLYNDGVGGRHEQEESGGDADHNRIDWTMVDDKAKLEERPDLFPSFVEHMMKNVANGLNTANGVLSTIMEYSDEVPARYVKQAARLLATDPAFAKAFFAKITGYTAETTYAPKFLKSKELRRAINATRNGDDYAMDLASVTLLGSDDAHKYFMNRRDDLDSNLEDAQAIIEGHLKLLPNDIVSRPQLHRFVYLLAEINRAASSYGVEKNQETSHEILSTLPAIDTKLTFEETERFSYLTTYGMSFDMQAAVYMLSLIKKGDIGSAEMIANKAGFREILSNRRLAKAFLTIKGASENFMRRVMGGFVALTEDNAGNDENIQRDLFAIIDKMDIVNLFSAENYYMFLHYHPERVEQVIYSDYRGQDADAVYHAVENLSAVEMICRVFNKQPLEPRNEAQRELFEIFCSLADISDDPDSGHPKFNFDPQKILDIMAANAKIMGNGIKNLGIDPVANPKFLTPDTAHKIAIWQFLSDDGGEYYTNVAKAGGAESFMRIVTQVFDNDERADGLIQIWAAWQKRPLSQLPSSGAFVVAELRKMSVNEDWARLQDFYNSTYKLVKGIERYLDTILSMMGAGVLKKFADQFGFTEDDVKAGGSFAGDMFMRLRTARSDFPAIIRIFPTLVDKTKIEMDTDPAYYV